MQGSLLGRSAVSFPEGGGSGSLRNSWNCLHIDMADRQRNIHWS